MHARRAPIATPRVRRREKEKRLSKTRVRPRAIPTSPIGRLIENCETRYIIKRQMLPVNLSPASWNNPRGVISCVSSFFNPESRAHCSFRFGAMLSEITAVNLINNRRHSC